MARLAARLTARARQEGVSMNTLVVAFIAEGLGKRDSKSRPEKGSET